MKTTLSKHSPVVSETKQVFFSEPLHMTRRITVPPPPAIKPGGFNLLFSKLGSAKLWKTLWHDSPFSPLLSPQASSRVAILPPPHAEQTQTTATGLLTRHPARPRHARGICSTHGRKYGRAVTYTRAFALRHLHSRFIGAHIATSLVENFGLEIFMANRRIHFAVADELIRTGHTSNGSDLAWDSLKLRHRQRICRSFLLCGPEVTFLSDISLFLSEKSRWLYSWVQQVLLTPPPRSTSQIRTDLW